MRRLITQLLLMSALSLSAAAQDGAAEPGTGQPTLDDLLKLVPEGPALVAAVPDFGEVVGGLGELGAIIGVNDLVELDADELLTDLELDEIVGTWRGRVRTDGPFVFVLMDPEADPLLLCAATEPAQVPSEEPVQFRGNIMVAARDAGILRAALSADGKFAQRFQQQARSLLDRHDVALLFNVPSWSAQIDQVLSLGEMFSQMGAATAATPESPANLTMVKWLFHTLRKGLSETETIVIASRVDSAGVRLGELTHFDRSGKVARYLGQVGKPKQDPLRGLVAEPGMFVMASEWTLPPDVETFSEQVVNAMLAGADPAQPDATEWKATTQRALKLYRVIAGYSGVMSFISDPAGMDVSGLYLTEKPQAVLGDFSALWKVSGPLMTSMAPGFSMETSERTEAVGSVEARVVEFSFRSDDEAMQTMLQSLYGESTTFYAAPHPDGVAYAMGPGKIARQNLEKLLAGKGPMLRENQRVIDALKELSPSPQAFVLLDLPRMMKWGMQLTGVPPAEAPRFALPETPTPYAGFGLYLEEAACAAELVLPARMIKTIVDWSKEPAETTTESEPY